MGVFAKRTKCKTRRRLRDVDQVQKDLTNARHLELYKETKAVEDLPGLGRHYCVECAKWFDMESTLVKHTKGKPHRRRLKELKEGPYTHKEADAAVGLWTDNGRGRAAETKEIDMM
ncbi:hypothetical protein SMACR_03519 [Sordaria macrospora]|uniref:WGS project CABT00000000 data, contig 2.9 n=2 Tax=Sordaria macrospora TaxID=5147 RepID=F7VVE8_SORMK|nr:uncharacterized protein SMAC_03519 [Sordaria macrospora k-hell]KAA8636192.1 hypothetical protein SMACR_03519 [Sordaria macrospora]KAH7625891.1 hypothetical protein B0T09DRAFT_325091 [Sordaria sp. MPI-SDFR-AT-0083]WPJ65915.1 hypothetical protein SMAC4_03519 [Sordaria macrospora]CCC09489.1 unnamed protein product [Sordaria macrospora k-hell]